LSILTESIPTNRLNIDGLTVGKKQKLDQVLEFLKTPHTPTEVGNHIGISRVKAYTDYIKILLDANKIKKLEGTKMYQITESNFTRKDLTLKLYSESEIMQTELMKRWSANTSAKNARVRHVRFSRICLGKVNPKFNLHPDSMTRENWESVITNAKNAILEVTKKSKLSYSDRQVLRHSVMYGLDITISEDKGIRLGIDGEKGKPRVSDLHIEPEQIAKAKLILKNDELNFCKFGFKCWTFVRPSTIYIVKTSDLTFYDREVKFVEMNGKRFYKKEMIDFAETILMVTPQASDRIKIGSFKHRACRLSVFENKTQDDYNKFIYDEDFAIALEKFVAKRKFQKKKYLFWDKNETEFTFENYDGIVRQTVVNDNKFFKKVFVELGFEKEDFGDVAFRANYGFRHFGLQMWLEATEYDYEFVSTMSHDDVGTLKKWYGKRRAEHQEQRASEVVF